MWKNSLNGKPRKMIKKIWNLKNPVHARDWVKTVLFRGEPITVLDTEAGDKIDVRTCTDKQIVEVARQISEYFKKKEQN